MTLPILVPVLAAMVLSLGLSAKQAPTATTPIPMPPDRVADSYAIYSSLIPLGETVGRGWPHDLWLVRDVTVTAVPANQPCKISGAAPRFNSSMNPHTAVNPPQDSLRDFAEILDDFDAHCRDVIALSPDLWHTSAPVRLLTAPEEQEFIAARISMAELPDKYKGAPALYGFSEVYFNLRHTVALVYATHWCGSLCGEGLWFAVGLENGQWKPLHWNATNWIS